MESFGIPRKLIKLAGQSVKNRWKLKVENDYSTTFEVKTGVRQGDGLSPMVFNIGLEGALKEIKRTELGIKIGNKISVFAFADDLVLLAVNKEDLKEMAKILIKKAQAVWLKVSDKKTKFMYFERGYDHSRSLEVEDHNFEKVEEFKYLSTIISSNNVSRQKSKAE